MDERLYIEQLKSIIGDLLAAGKPRLGWKTLWQMRVIDAKALLEKPRAPTQSPAARFVTYERDGGVSFDIAGWLRTPEGQKQLGVHSAGAKL